MRSSVSAMKEANVTVRYLTAEDTKNIGPLDARTGKKED